MNIPEQDLAKFDGILDQLDAIRAPMCSTPDGVMLSEDLDGCISQLHARLEQIVEDCRGGEGRTV